MQATERTVVQEPAEVWRRTLRICEPRWYPLVSFACSGRQQLQKDSVPQEALVAASRRVAVGRTPEMTLSLGLTSLEVRVAAPAPEPRGSRNAMAAAADLSSVGSVAWL